MGVARLGIGGRRTTVWEALVGGIATFSVGVQLRRVLMRRKV